MTRRGQRHLGIPIGGEAVPRLMLRAGCGTATGAWRGRACSPTRHRQAISTKCAKWERVAALDYELATTGRPRRRPEARAKPPLAGPHPGGSHRRPGTCQASSQSALREATNKRSWARGLGEAMHVLAHSGVCSLGHLTTAQTSAPVLRPRARPHARLKPGCQPATMGSGPWRGHECALTYGACSLCRRRTAALRGPSPCHLPARQPAWSDANKPAMIAALRGRRRGL
jgi:hypothetical protein